MLTQVYPACHRKPATEVRQVLTQMSPCRAGDGRGKQFFTFRLGLKVKQHYGFIHDFMNSVIQIWYYDFFVVGVFFLMYYQSKQVRSIVRDVFLM